MARKSCHILGGLAAFLEFLKTPHAYVKFKEIFLVFVSSWPLQGFSFYKYINLGSFIAPGLSLCVQGSFTRLFRVRPVSAHRSPLHGVSPACSPPPALFREMREKWFHSFGCFCKVIRTKQVNFFSVNHQHQQIITAFFNKLFCHIKIKSFNVQCKEYQCTLVSSLNRSYISITEADSSNSFSAHSFHQPLKSLSLMGCSDFMLSKLSSI